MNLLGKQFYIALLSSIVGAVLTIFYSKWRSSEN